MHKILSPTGKLILVKRMQKRTKTKTKSHLLELPRRMCVCVHITVHNYDTQHSTEHI